MVKCPVCPGEARLSVVHARALYRRVRLSVATTASVVEFDVRTHLVEVCGCAIPTGGTYRGGRFGVLLRSELVVPEFLMPLVVFVRERPDLSYKLWEQPKVPDLVVGVLWEDS